MTTTDLPAHVGVYGGGRMGAGIAHAFLVAASTVTVVEVNESAAESARDRVVKSLAAAHERGKLDEELDVVTARLSVGHEAVALAGAELVIEAVPEDLELKAGVLALVQEAAPRAVLATNTSSLSVDALAARLEAPGRFLGLHFFNPVPSSSLVEIVVGDRTDEEVAAAARAWVNALGKTAITVTDSPGFASSRLGVAIALEAMRMLQEGVASAEDIDTAMTLGYRHPVGPLRTTDIVGLDVRLAIAEHLAVEVGPRFEPPAMLRKLVADGKLGRKSGEGFYRW